MAGLRVRGLLCGSLLGPPETQSSSVQELLSELGARLGDWILVVSPRPNSFASHDPCWLRLVASSEVLVCPPPPWRKRRDLPLIHLPAQILELLGSTPGRTEVSVAFREGLAPAECSRLVVSSVPCVLGQETAMMRFRSEAALRSFFHVPRVLKRGEVFSVPVDGLPDVLCEVEVPADPAKRPRQRMPLGEEGDDVYEMAACSGRSRRFLIDPLHGAAFCDLFSFKVEVVEGRESQSTTFRVDSRSAQILLKGQSQARGLPYCRCHLFCQAPPQPLPSLQGPAERLLGMLAPCVRGWELGATSDLPSVLVSGPRGCGKRVLWHSVCERLGLHLFEMNCTALAAEGLGSLEARLSEASAQAAGVSPCVLCLRRLHALSSSGATMSPAATLLQQRRIEDFLQSALQKARTSPAVGGKSPLVLLAGSCESLDDLGGPIRQSFSQELAVPRPNEVARKFAISELLKRVDTTPNSVVVMNGMSDASEKNTEPTVITAITKLTAGLSYSDLRSVCAELAMNKSALSSLEATATASSEVQQAVEQAVKRLQGGSKVAVTLASKIQWADVGGLQDAKEEIMNCITLPLSQGQMFEGQKVRSGVLLFGPPGTGKTLLAKAVATECKVHFLSVKGPELLSMYIGESEKNVRSLFQSARDLAPCVLFFDELDSLAPARGRGSDSGGVMDRVVSQLVTELDTMPSTVFMVGATNRPDLLDRSLLRPGRLDRMVYLGVAADKLPLLSAITRKFVLEAAAPANGTKRASNLLAAVAEACPPNLTGADVSVLCADAYGIAQREHISKLHEAADLLQTPISTFLLFLDALELHLTDALRGPRTYDAFWKMSASHGIALVQLCLGNDGVRVRRVFRNVESRPELNRFPAVSDEALSKFVQPCSIPEAFALLGSVLPGRAWACIGLAVVRCRGSGISHTPHAAGPISQCRDLQESFVIATVSGSHGPGRGWVTQRREVLPALMLLRLPPRFRRCLLLRRKFRRPVSPHHGEVGGIVMRSHCMLSRCSSP